MDLMSWPICKCIDKVTKGMLGQYDAKGNARPI
jgi:hypothetical protein